MAKAKAKKSSDKTKGKAKKDSGAKLSKALSKFAPLKDLMNSDLGRELLADALIAAAGAAAAALTRSRTAKKAGAATAEAGSLAADATRDAMQTAAGAVAGVVSETARQFLPATLLGEEDKDERAPTRSAAKETKPRYVHRTSDHSKRKTTRKVAKTEKSGKSGGAAKQA